MPQATDLLHAVADGSWPEPIAEQLAAEIAQRVQGTVAIDGRRRHTLQNFLYPEAYLRQDHWDFLTSQSPTRARMQVMVDHMLRLRCRYPSEKSYHAVAALLIACQDADEDTSSRLVFLHDFKQVFKRSRAQLLPCSDEPIIDYPCYSDVFRQQHPGLYEEVFGDVSPIETPLLAGKLGLSQRAQPMRRTRSGALAACSVVGAQNAGVANAMKLMENMASMMMSCMGHARPQFPQAPTPSVQIFGNALPSHRAQLSLQGSTPALMSTAAETTP